MSHYTTTASVHHVETPSLHIQLGSTMALKATPPPGSSHPAYGGYNPQYAQQNQQYAQHNTQYAQHNPQYGHQYAQHGAPNPQYGAHNPQYGAFNPQYGAPNTPYGAHNPQSPDGQYGASQQQMPQDIYGKLPFQLPSFSMPISGSSTFNILPPAAPPSPNAHNVVRGQELYATRIPIGPPSPPPPDHHGTATTATADAQTSMTFNMGVQTPAPEVTPAAAPPPLAPRQVHSMGTQVNVGQQPPATMAKPSHTHSHSSTGSVTSSGLGSMPSSPLMTSSDTSGALSRLKLHDGEVDAESLTWSSLDDTRSERSYTSSGDVDSACSVGTPGEDKEAVPTYDRVGIVGDDKTAVIVQLACESDEGTSNEKFIDLVAGVATACAQYFRKKEAEKETMNPTQLGQVIMADRRPVKEHLQEVSQTIGENVSIMRADCRRVNGKGYVGTYVLDNVTYKGRTSVSKHGVVVVLKKLNKFACCKEFAEQLCLHILSARPEQLGKGELSTAIEARKKPVNPRSLLTQRFYCDQTCNVYEAAKRSFVEVTDFVLY